MDKAGYIDVRQHLSFSKPLWVTLAVMAADLALLYVAFVLLATGSWLLYIVSQVLLTIFYFHNFALLHEAGHSNVSDKRWVNTLIGHYSSVFCFLPYFPWKFIHQEHHVWAGNIDKDPTMKNLKDVREKGKISLIGRLTWRSWVPLTAFLQHVVFWSYPLTMCKTGKMHRRAFLLSFLSVAWLAVAYTLMFAYLPQWVNWHNLWLSLVLYLFMTEMVNLPHHVNVPTFHTSDKRDKLHPWEQHITTRTCFYPLYLSELLTLNFNYHTEHHFFPNLPWFRLRRLQRLIRPQLGKDYNEVFGLGWNIKNRKRDIEDVALPEVHHPLL